MSPLPARLENHWAPEPGVDPSRARLMWFMLVGDNPQVAALARQGQYRLGGLPGLDLVPKQWLHITTLIAGYANQITSDQVSYMTSHARQQATRIKPITLTLGRILYHPRAIMLRAGTPDQLEPVLHAVQEATRAATGRHGELHTAPWTPHITLAYSNTAQPAGPAIRALGRELPMRDAIVTSVSLISQRPDQRWTWDSVADIPLGLSTGTSGGYADSPSSWRKAGALCRMLTSGETGGGN